MMTPSEIVTLIQRVRRDMSRNQLAMQLCDACEKLVTQGNKKAPLTRAEIQRRYRERKKAQANG